MGTRKNIIILKIKRFIVFLIVNKFTGYLLSLFIKESINFQNTKIKIKHLNYAQIAALYFNIYESKEVLFINKYLNKKIPCIELGSSLGIVSCQIGKLNKNKKIFIEANSTLKNTIESNLQLNGIDNYEVINAAISYDKNGYIEFSISDNNLTGKINHSQNRSSNLIRVKSTTLKEVIDKAGFEEYVLVMDIEGAEYELILNEAKSLTNCSQIIAEFHDFEYNNRTIKFQEIASLYLENGFKLVESYHNRYVFERS